MLNVLIKHYGTILNSISQTTKKMEIKFPTIGQKANYAALMAILPPRGFGYARRVADLLNANNAKPMRAEKYSANVVHQVVHKHYFDLNVEPAIIQLAEDLYGKPIEELLPEYVRAFPKRTFKRQSTTSK